MARYLVPLGVFIVIVGFLAVGLTKDPSLVPSPLIGKAAPDFSLPSVRDPAAQVSRSDLQGKVTLLNVWATWCVACRQEHGMLLEIANSGEVLIYGLNYKDQRDLAIRWLDQLGDPYVASAFDQEGRVAIDFGVYGAPETFVVDPNGYITYKHIGPITPEVWQKTLLPIVRKLKQDARAS